MPILPKEIRNVMRCAIAAAAFVLLPVLNACHGPAPAPTQELPPTVPSPVAPAVAPVSRIDQDRLDLLLDQGDRALAAGRLLTPIDDCAYDYYRQALVVAPNHPAAVHGLERIADRYIGMAEQAAERGQFDTAKAMLKHASYVDADRPGIAETEALIELRSTAKGRHVALDTEQLSAHAAGLADQLKTLGAQAKAQDAWVIIHARSDAEGRWIYQQLASAAGERRIRAELTIGAPPAVDLLQLNDTK
jgi:hypothetical protein